MADELKPATKGEKIMKLAKQAAPAGAPPLPALDVATVAEPEVVARRALPETIEAAVAAPPAAKPFPSFETMMKGMPIMTDTTAFTNPTGKAQAMFGDFNSRAKTAAEKGAKFVEELSDLTKGNVEALIASGKIAAKGAEDLGAEAAAYSKASFEKTTGVFKSLTAVKSPAELLQIQSEFAKSSFDAMIAESSKLTESFVKLATDVMQPISSRIAVAAEKMKSTAL